MCQGWEHKFPDLNMGSDGKGKMCLVVREEQSI